MPKIQVNGIDLYYELHGDASSPVLVLNNGLIMNAATSWIMQTTAFARHYHVLQYDCRGQGQSDHPEETYTMELHADDLAALLEGLGINHAHIAGISYGGEVAQAFVLKFPQKTQSLILADTVSEVSPKLRIVIESWIDALRSGYPLSFFHATVPWNFSAQFIKDNPVLIEDAKRRYAELDFSAVINLSNCFLTVDFTSRLHAIKVPTCIIVGEYDHLKGVGFAQILKKNLVQAELHIIQEAGHATCWERAKEFNSIVLGFLSKQEEVSM